MTSTKQKSHLSSSSDPLEANLLQIEETNKLLSSLEAKISNLFTQTTMPSLGSPTDRDLLNLKSPPNVSSIRSRLHNRSSVSGMNFKDTSRTPTATFESNYKQQRKYINIIEPTGDSGDVKGRDSHDQTSPGQPARSLPSLYGASPIRDEDPNDTQKQDLKTSFNNDKSMIVRGSVEGFGHSNNVTKREEKLENARESFMQGPRKESGENFLDKMAQMEKFYKEKVEILQDKVGIYEEEAKKTAKANENLNREIDGLRAVLEESRRSEQVYQEKEIKWAIREQEWNKERKGLEREIEELKKAYREVVGEKEELEKRYEGLLKLQREMIQMDMERNEKNLRSSVKTEEKGESERVVAVLQMMEQYKEEMEYLKENNNLMTRQLLYEISQLKEELGEQRRVNKKVESGGRMRGNGTRKESGQFGGETGGKKEESSRNTTGRENQEYVREWREYQQYGDEMKTLKSAGSTAKMMRRVEDRPLKVEERSEREKEKEETGNRDVKEKRVLRRERIEDLPLKAKYNVN